MKGPLKHLKVDLHRVGAAWTDGQPAFAAAGADAQVQIEAMSDRGLLETTDAVARLVRGGEALLARLAAEVARRSPREAGAGGLAKREGFANPVQLVASSTGGGIGGAARLVKVGTATADRTSLTGDRLAPVHPHVAAALRSGSISLEAAAAITTMLDRVAPRAEPETADRFERLLSERAGQLSLDYLMRAIREVEARLDPDGVEPREEELREARCLTLRQDGHGMLRVSGALDPETAAPVKAVIETLVTHSIRANSPAGGPDAGPVVPDQRSIPQLQADALGMIARHAIGCTRMPDAPAMAVVVRADLEALTDGLGHANIDGLDQPVSAGTARKLAASAGIIPAVMGTDSVPLNLGRASRLFDRYQRIALAERDGGCACCGLDLSYAEAHHIRWWTRDQGRTDLDNGVMLCPPCHTRIHHDGWMITVRDGQVWFTPPPHVDPDQKPRLGGRARFGLPRAGCASPPGRTPGRPAGRRRSASPTAPGEAGPDTPRHPRTSRVAFSSGTDTT